MYTVLGSGVIVIVKVSAAVGRNASCAVGHVVPGIGGLADAVTVGNAVVVDAAVAVGGQLDNGLADVAAGLRDVVVVNILGVAESGESEENGDGLELHFELFGWLFDELRSEKDV